MQTRHAAMQPAQGLQHQGVEFSARKQPNSVRSWMQVCSPHYHSADAKNSNLTGAPNSTETNEQGRTLMSRRAMPRRWQKSTARAIC